MNSDILKGKWKQLRGEVQQWWGELTDDDLDQIKGGYDKLAGRLQAKYGWSKQRAQEEIDRRLDKYKERIA
jgi:uncharacterized protein YjbJ (UPF0337 family)